MFSSDSDGMAILPSGWHHSTMDSDPVSTQDDDRAPRDPGPRKWLFASLYFSEGAPIAFCWLALPGLLTGEGVALPEITQLTTMLILPWTFKFLWAPLIDRWRNSFWTFRHWILIAQLGMIATLLPLAGLNLGEQLPLVSLLLMAHAIAAATQDVAIDGLCIATSVPEERGRLNGWMQAGMLLGRSAFGGGSLFIASRIGQPVLIVLLCAATAVTGLFVMSPWADRWLEEGRQAAERRNHELHSDVNSSESGFLSQLRHLLFDRRTWIGLFFALTAGAAFEAWGAVQTPLLMGKLDEDFVVALLAGPVVLGMFAGSLVGGWIADRWTHRMGVVVGTAVFLAGVLGNAIQLDSPSGPSQRWVLVFGVLYAVGVGMFTAASYALLMDLAKSKLAATKFSLFMAGTNGCEFWAGRIAGAWIPNLGVTHVMFALAPVTAVTMLATIFWTRNGLEDDEPKPESERR